MDQKKIELDQRRRGMLNPYDGAPLDDDDFLGNELGLGPLTAIPTSTNEGGGLLDLPPLTAQSPIVGERVLQGYTRPSDEELASLSIDELREENIRRNKALHATIDFESNFMKPEKKQRKRKKPDATKLGDLLPKRSKSKRETQNIERLGLVPDPSSLELPAIPLPGEDIGSSSAAPLVPGEFDDVGNPF